MRAMPGVILITLVLASRHAPGSRNDEPALPSLDELLGIAEDGTSAELDDAALERKLSAQEVGERFEQAVVLMGDAASRIDESGDLGLQTQRIQEDILKKLDQVIEAAQQQQSGGGGSSGSSSGQQQRQQQQPDQSSQSQGAQQGGSESGENMPGASTDARLNPGVAPDGATWGNLPQRERDAVSQGVNDRYSALYRRLTELYYRRLAEQEGNE
ncbi:MAG: hypothetical protein AAGA55_00510 [Planctomycetota bacterium]